MFPGTAPAEAALRALSAGSNSAAPFPDAASSIEACRRGGSRTGHETERPFRPWRLAGGSLLRSSPLYKACAAFLQKPRSAFRPSKGGDRLQVPSAQRFGTIHRILPLGIRRTVRG